MLKTKCFIIVTILFLSLQVKGITYCPTVPAEAIIRRQQLDKERREREQREQYELLKQRGMIEEHQEITLPEAIALIMFASFLAFLPIFIERFFS